VCVPITDATAEWFAEIKRMLRKKGNPIPSNDVWIAASCMEHGCHLLSFDIILVKSTACCASPLDTRNQRLTSQLFSRSSY